MAAYPKTFQELKDAGYKFQNDGTCRNCRAEIEWWETKTGKKLPFNPMPPPSSAPAVLHFKTCRNQDR